MALEVAVVNIQAEQQINLLLGKIIGRPGLLLKSQQKYFERTERLEQKIEKYRSLEKTASVLSRLSDHKEKMFSDGKDFQSKNIEHKRDEVER